MNKTEHYSHQPSSWTAVFLATIPIFVFSVAVILNEIKGGALWEPYYYPLWNLICVAGLGVGWIKGFPHWSYPYLSMSVIFGWWWSDVHISGIPWGNRAWAPFFIMVLIALLWTRSLKPLQRLVSSIWNDWTLLSFILYGMMAWVAIGAAYDENHHPQLVFFIIGSTVAVTIGVVAYLQSLKKWQKIGSLVVGLLFSFVIQAVVNHIYWSEHLEPWMEKPYTWGNTIQQQIIIFSLYAAVLCTPTLFSLLPPSSRRILPS